MTTELRRILIRGATAAQWTSTNPTLAQREMGVERDTGRAKVGTGAAAWSALPYVDSVTAAAAVAALAAHAADTTGIHGIADTTALVLTSDPRLSNPRTPTAHAASHAPGGTDPITERIAQVVCTAGQFAVVFAAIPQDYDDLRIVWHATGHGGVPGQILVRINGDIDPVYSSTSYQLSSTAPPGLASQQEAGTVVLNVGGYGDAGGAGVVDVPGYASTDVHQALTSHHTRHDTVSPRMTALWSAGERASMDPITQIDLYGISAGNFGAGSTFTLLGSR